MHRSKIPKIFVHFMPTRPITMSPRTSTTLRRFFCVLRLKRLFCLRRSAATTLLLRRHGHDAELVIGAKLLPFRSHAWVELNGQVINDRPYMHTIYQVLELC